MTLALIVRRSCRCRLDLRVSCCALGTHRTLGIEPLDALTILPQSELTTALGVSEATFSVLMTVVPLTLVRLSIRPVVAAETFLALVDILTLISPTIGPSVNALAV